MRLRFSDEDEAFRAELRAWLDANPPPVEEERADPSRSSADKRPWAVRWQRTLFDAGYLVPGWPPELGGRNANPAQQMIYFDEITRRDIRRTTNPQGLSIITPSLVDYGT
ncbi:MAG TPA: acyl-CoA dehydrogenase family protein, partial [Acidimicrobiales bacterium]|nr:acyl-CoA dehydrogenase family protein [Acidimicrobiales bacterium]